MNYFILSKEKINKLTYKINFLNQLLQKRSKEKSQEIKRNFANTNYGT